MKRFFSFGSKCRADIEAGAFVLGKNGDSVLLAKKGYGPYKGLWTLPEGCVEEGETPAEAIKRELVEELNGQAEVIDLAAVRFRRSKKGNSVYFVFNCCLLNDDLKTKDGELEDFKFFDFEEAGLDKGVYSLVKTLIEKIKSRPECFKRSKFCPPETGISKEDYILYL